MVIVFAISLAICCLLVAISWACWTLVDHDHGWHAVGLAVLSTTVAITALVGYMDAKSTDAHQWRGGAGPDTACRYDVKPLPAGKTVVPVRFTVCD